MVPSFRVETQALNHLKMLEVHDFITGVAKRRRPGPARFRKTGVGAPAVTANPLVQAGQELAYHVKGLLHVVRIGSLRLEL